MQVNATSRSSSRPSLAAEQVLKRARGVSMYATAPREELTLEEFESFAVDRLIVLRMIENLRIRGFKAREVEQQMRPVLKKHGLEDDRRKDIVSHYVLRLAYSKTEDLRRWFLAQEAALFRLRLESLSSAELEVFLHDHDISFEEVPKENIAGGGVSYLVPFTQALELVAKRQVAVEKGKVVVPQSKIHSIIIARFRTALSKSLATASQFFADIAADPRLASLLRNVDRHDVTPEKNVVDDSEQITADQLDALAATSMPLCMRVAHDALRREHKLKHWGRVQYGLFLKAAGLPMEEQLKFFEAEFTKVMTHEQFNKEHAYGVRHRYGKEGKRTDYTPYGCFKIIMDFAPGPGEFHGCPYKHYGKDRLAALLSTLSIRGPTATEILDLASNHNYQIACQRHFEAAHPDALEQQDLSLAGVGNHPNAYFKASRAYHRAAKAASSTLPPGASS